MLLIGESLNVISRKIGRAFKERDPKPIQEEAQFQREKGMAYIDINLGPAKKDLAAGAIFSSSAAFAAPSLTPGSPAPEETTPTRRAVLPSRCLSGWNPPRNLPPLPLRADGRR